MERRMLYRLTTKDGIKSEIKDGGHPTFAIRRACNNRSRISFTELDASNVFQCREYKYRSSELIELVEYEEE